jgi:L-lysine 6-transaminase
MVRSTHNLLIIERENLVKHAATIGRTILDELHELAAREPLISAVRGRGLFIAFDLPDRDTRERFYEGLFEIGLLAIRCGQRSIRFRPALDFPVADATAVIAMVQEQCRRMRAGKGSAPPAPRVTQRKPEAKAG